MIEYKYTKEFTEEQLCELFSAVNWFSAKFPKQLKKAFSNAGCIISAWDNEQLVGLIRGLNDGIWIATIDCLLINPQYQKRGIASTLIKLFLEEHKDYFYVDVVVDERNNAPLYQKHGFNIMEGMTTLRIVNENWV